MRQQFLARHYVVDKENAERQIGGCEHSQLPGIVLSSGTQQMRESKYRPDRNFSYRTDDYDIHMVVQALQGGRGGTSRVHLLV